MCASPAGAAGDSATGAVYRLKVTLAEIRPQIWRRLEISDARTLKQLHLAVQARAIQCRRPKSDPVDADCLAGLLRTDGEAYRPIQPDSALTRQLRMLTRDLSEPEKTHVLARGPAALR